MLRLIALLSLGVLGCSSAHGIELDAGPIVDDGGPPTSTCPPEVDPYDPLHAACGTEGATCTNRGGICAGLVRCTCESGRWQCLVAEPDPVCSCGRQPATGDPCTTEGMACGECCPTAGGTGWPAMTCVDGHWQGAACPANVCPPVEAPSCPVDTRALLGAACSPDALACGDGCCGNAITCSGGTWQPGPEADCFACTSYACGDGLCRADETCVSDCGPTDGAVFSCAPRATGCEDCACITLQAGQSCTMIDAHPHVVRTCR